MIVYSDGCWDEEELEKMADGHFIERNRKLYGMCCGCHKIVRVDKPILGSIHICKRMSYNKL